MKRILILALLIPGCATTEKFDRNLRKNLKHNISDVIRANGSPNHIFTLPDGTKGYEYFFDNGDRIENSFGIVSLTHSSCLWTFYTDKKDIIRSYSFKGNACRARS